MDLDKLQVFTKLFHNFNVNMLLMMNPMFPYSTGQERVNTTATGQERVNTTATGQERVNTTATGQERVNTTAMLYFASFFVHKFYLSLLHNKIKMIMRNM